MRQSQVKDILAILPRLDDAESDAGELECLVTELEQTEKDKNIAGDYEIRLHLEKATQELYGAVLSYRDAASYLRYVLELHTEHKKEVTA